MGLVAKVWSKGGTAKFEYIGRQSRVRVRYMSTDLMLVAVRGRELGTWWQHEDLVELGQQHAFSDGGAKAGGVGRAGAKGD